MATSSTMDGSPPEEGLGGGLVSVSTLGVGLIVHRAEQALFGDARTTGSATTVILDRYVLKKKLGAGAMGTVYEAHDLTLDRMVAVKILHRDLSQRHHQRMQREALALAKLSHPNVVHVYEVGRSEDRTFIAMELVHGKTLDQWQRSRPSWRECLQVYLQAGQGLAAAHAVGLVHRDFKPSNCIIGDDGRVRVLDFGLARATHEELERADTSSERSDEPDLSTRLTETGVLLGTVAYMPLEQLAGQVANEASDQFSFCVSFYEALYGMRPFAGGSMDTLAAALVRGVPRAPPSGARVPACVRRAVLRGLAVDPRKRWPSMEALLQRLSSLARRRPSWLVVATIGLTAALGVAGGVALTAPQNQPCERAESVLDDAWGDQQRTALQQRFHGSGLPQASELGQRVEQRIDDYAHTWVEGYLDSCRATFVDRRQSEAVHDQRMRCLQRRRNRLESAVAVLVGRDGGSALLDAAVVPFQLPLVEDCADLEMVQSTEALPADPEARQAIASLRQRIDEVETLKLAGSNELALAEALVIVDDARSNGHDAVMAEALEQQGRLLADERRSGARAVLEQAIEHAARAHDDVTAAKAWATLIYVLAGQGDFEDMRKLEFAARAAVDRSGDEEARGWLLNNLGVSYAVTATHEPAIRYLREALELKQRTLGPEHVDVGISLANLGLALMRWGAHDEEARQAFLQARSIVEHTVGSGHRLMFVIDSGLCRLDARSNLQNPQVVAQRCAEVLERHGGDESLPSYDKGEVRYALARALWFAGMHDEATVEVTRAKYELGDDLFSSDDLRAWIEEREREQGVTAQDDG